MKLRSGGSNIDQPNGNNKNKSKDGKITKKKKGKKNKSNLKKGKKANSEALNANSYYIVPWKNSADWEQICTRFNNRDYEEVIRELRMWQERVPSLPIGVESSLFCLEAIVVDKKGNRDDETKSLYSLALVRYLNHISHLATKELGENAPVPLSQLASHMNVPDWIVDLRHDISHGTTLPSLEVLRLASEFIMTWLLDNYWVKAGNGINPSEIELLSNKKENKETKEEKYMKMCNFVSAYIASKIYQIRGKRGITDPDITQALPNQPQSVKSKMAIGYFKTQLANLFTTDSLLLCQALANEMIPSEEFLNAFASVIQLPMNEEGEEQDQEQLLFQEYKSLWLPIIELIQTRGKVPQLCSLLSQIHIREEETTKTIKLYSALWLDYFLELLGQEEKVYPHRLKSILYSVITNVNEFTSIYLPRLLSMLENVLGVEKIRQLETLFKIWSIGSLNGEEKRNRENIGGDLFTLEELMGVEEKKITTNVSTFQFKPLSFNQQKQQQQKQQQQKQQVISNWDMDSRDLHFWRNVPLGGKV